MTGAEHGGQATAEGSELSRPAIGRGSRLSLPEHYRQLLFFALNRFRGDNYRRMGEYFAEILINEIEEFMPLRGKRVLDVGGATGVFCRVINEKRQCDAVNLDPHPGECVWPQTTVGFADDIPFGDNEFDVLVCRGVLEHVPTGKQQQSLNEMHRVTKIGGICYILISPWYNPHAGHQLKPFHTLPFKLAKRLRQLIFRDRIEADSLPQLSLYPITFRAMRKMIAASHFRMLATRDTHLRLHFLTKIPLIREIAVPAVAFVLTKQAR